MAYNCLSVMRSRTRDAYALLGGGLKEWELLLKSGEKCSPYVMNAVLHYAGQLMNMSILKIGFSGIVGCVKSVGLSNFHLTDEA